MTPSLLTATISGADDSQLTESVRCTSELPRNDPTESLKRFPTISRGTACVNTSIPCGPGVAGRFEVIPDVGSVPGACVPL
jgi:hypothetical protein